MSRGRESLFQWNSVKGRLRSFSWCVTVGPVDFKETTWAVINILVRDIPPYESAGALEQRGVETLFFAGFWEFPNHQPHCSQHLSKTLARPLGRGSFGPLQSTRGAERVRSGEVEKEGFISKYGISEGYPFWRQDFSKGLVQPATGGLLI